MASSSFNTRRVSALASIRIALESGRGDRTMRRAEQYQVTAAGLPTSGSTAVLFGCRDGFVLAGAGCPARPLQISTAQTSLPTAAVCGSAAATESASIQTMPPIVQSPARRRAFVLAETIT